MTTNYLRFPNQAAWESAATEAGFYTKRIRARDDDGTFVANDPETPENEAWELSELNAYTHDWAIDVVGTIYNDDAVLDPDTGAVVTPATPKTGYHVNFIGALPEGWSAFLVTPVAPYRVFA
jgi:hypothetical protein